MSLQSICPRYQIEDSKADYKSAQRVGRIRMSDQAFYFFGFPDAKYLPFAALRRIWAENRTTHANCGCGRVDLPSVVLRVLYEGGFYQNFTFEEQEEADRVLDHLRRVLPDLPQGPEDPPEARREEPL